MSERKYGFFKCKKCGVHWESSHVYCRSGTKKVLYAQDCKKCKGAVMPYRTEKIRCAVCGERDACMCSREDKKKRHVDPNKPHRRDLCHKCRSGRPCVERY